MHSAKAIRLLEAANVMLLDAEGNVPRPNGPMKGMKKTLS